METAAGGAAEWIRRIAAGRSVTVLCGPGNNGGDGYVIARRLRESGNAVTVIAPLEPATEAAREARRRWGGAVATAGRAAGDVLVDCLFGSGLARPLIAEHALLLRDGVPVAALGTPGGDQQDQWQLLYLLRTLVGGYSPQQAIDAPALHTTSMPGSFWPRTWTPGGAVVEDRIGADVVAGLRARGHEVTVAGGWTLGRLSTVERDPATGVLQAAANSRGAQGYAAGR